MRPISIAAAVLLLAGCAGNGSLTTAANAATAPRKADMTGASYAGTTLTVDGRAYPRPDGVRDCNPHVCLRDPDGQERRIAKGRLLVGVRADQSGQARALLQRFGLDVTRELSGGRTLLVAVRPLFEAQWLAAFGAQTVFEFVEFDTVMTLQRSPAPK